MDFRKIRKSKSHFLAGVAAGIAKYQGVSKFTVRGFFLVTTIITGGLGVILYSILALTMPPPENHK